MCQTIADTHLNLNNQALAVLAVLGQSEPDFADWDAGAHEYVIETTTAAWYNGRERGFSLVVRRTIESPVTLVIIVAQHRNSGDIIVWSWRTKKRFLNPPTVGNLPKNHVDKDFPYGRIDKAVDYIRKLMADFLAAQKP
jgi:hypothetical protein